ncbi:hypothetical protein BLNAU_11784 [Blattamonas nauphoetae]|uniref:Uncharacterized protein n=1 Tax=Blattamonas nauphoetae TaxID=2049346 RepID=A0ABQ9XS17_9EUKA|nr:hypothetical protein BLNAU_11784 [Blattamonas nauphoetae]
MKRSHCNLNCSCFLFTLILPLLVAIPILTTRAMTQVKNGITRSNPFPWFIPDSLFCVLIIILLVQVTLFPKVRNDRRIKLGVLFFTVIASISILLIVLVELLANIRFIEQLSIDAMSSQQSDTEQTSTDQPPSPDEVKQPAVDPGNHQHSNSSNTPVSNIPIPRRARIPIKTLVILAAGLLITTWILSSDLHLEQSEWRSLGIFVLLIALLISAIPVVIALKGMQIIHDRWFVLSLPLLIIAPPALFGLARLALEEESTELAFFAALVISLSTFIAAVIADDVAS